MTRSQFLLHAARQVIREFGTKPSRRRFAAARHSAWHAGFAIELLEPKTLLSGTGDVLDEAEIARIQSLEFSEFPTLSPTQIQHLTTTQVGSIPDEWWLSRIPEDSRAALTTTQIQALNTAGTGIAPLTAMQIEVLSATQVQSLDQYDFRYLPSSQIVHLSAAQIGTIENEWWFAQIPEASRAALSAAQIRGLNTQAVGAGLLTATQVNALTASQIRQLSYHSFEYLPPTQMAHLSAEQVGTIPNEWWFSRIPEASRAALTSVQVRGLVTADVGLRSLTVRQVNALTVEQIRAVSYDQFRYVTATRIRALTAAQLASIPNQWWLEQIPADARAQMSVGQVRSLNVGVTGIRPLTETQISWLTAVQVRSLSQDQFPFLSAAKIRYLTATQLASIDNGWWFQQISNEARAALVPWQVRSLRVEAVGIGGLTDQQVTWLTVAQVRQLDYNEFERLDSRQIRWLTAAQLQTIGNRWWFARIPETVRAALTNAQVQALPGDALGLEFLTPAQQSVITVAQIQSLQEWDFSLLTPRQIVHLTIDQMATISSAWMFKRISDESRAALSREQLLAMDDTILTSKVGLPDAFAVAAADMEHGDEHPHPEENPHGGDPAKAAEHAAVFALVPHEAATHVTIASGDWSDPATWQGGAVPDAGAEVLVSADHVVTFDAVITQALHTVRIDGTLTFDATVETQLKADTIIVDANGVLSIGTAAAPIGANGDVTARILIADTGEIDATWDPLAFSRGLISHGAVEMYGQYVTPFLALAVDPLAGDEWLTLSETPVNWNVGDRLVLTGTEANYSRNEDEELEIIEIVGNRVRIDANSATPGIDALEYDHTTVGYGTSVYVANMNRNIVVLSENVEDNERRGHVMFMHKDDVQVHNVGFYGLGRTDKRNPLNDPILDEHGQRMEDTGLNPAGRYSVHFHRAGVNDDGGAAVITGSAVVDSPGWGIVNHDSFVHMRDNVAFHIVGASFVTEFGNEIGSMIGNLSINNSGSGDGIEDRRDIFDFGHGGHGFWLQGPGVAVEDNVAAGSADGAFVFFTSSSKARFDAANLDDPAMAAGHDSVPVGAVPLKSVRNNQAFASRRGLETWFHMTDMNDGQSVVEDFTSWNTRDSGIFTPYTGRTTIRNAIVVGDEHRMWSTGIDRNNVTNQMTYDNVTVVGWGIGISAPVNRTTVIRDGYFKAVRAIQIDRAEDLLREVDIVGDPTFVTLTDSELRERDQFDIFMNGGFQMENFDLETLFSPDIIRLGTVMFNNHQLYYHEQASDFVPFQAGLVPDFIPAELLGRTNAELSAEFGIALAGTIAPPDATDASEFRINGLLGTRADYQPQLELLSRKYTNELAGYVLRYIDDRGRLVEQAPVDLREGWNLLTYDVNGTTRTFFVMGDIEAPTFVLADDADLRVNPNGLRFGFVVHGDVFDNSFGHKSFRQKFDNLEELPVLMKDDGTQYLELTFTIRDAAGNETEVRLELILDPDAPIVPGTNQRDLPPRDMPLTLLELLRTYIIFS